MVNNFTNINKTNNHLSPQLTEHKKKRHMTSEIQVFAWDRQKNVAGLNALLFFNLKNGVNLIGHSETTKLYPGGWRIPF